MKYFLGLLAVVAVAAGLTKLGYDRYQDEIRTRIGGASVTTTTRVVLPGANQVVVTGKLTHAHLEKARLAPLAMPLTITTPQRGDGSGGTFQAIAIDGQPQTAVWDAGTPLQLAGDGSLAVGPLTLEVADGSASLTFDGMPQGITPGNYTIGSPVAVGKAGVATARDSVSFTAGATSTLTLSADATTVLPGGPVAAKGPGKVVLEGDLAVLRADGSTTKVASITLEQGPFQITLTPGPGGTFEVRATLQGDTATT